jgi:TRAP-type C4-dicarboxylate transport system substrate-binding protein
MTQLAAAQLVLRFGTIVPDGTGRARELRAAGRDEETASGGRLSLKFYMNGVAGDEMEMIDRVKRRQLDGIMSGGMACERIAPSLRVTRLPGVFQTWEETSSAISRLKPILDKEAERNGFVNIGEAVVGPSVVFSRRPIANMKDFAGQKLWIWSTDDVLKDMLPRIGVEVAALPIHEAGRAYDDGRIDGFVTPAAAALGFRWSAQARYFTELRMGFISGCLLISTAAFDSLSPDLQTVLRASAAKAQVRFERVGRSQERELLDGLFRKQGLTPVRVDESVRATFFSQARIAREHIPPTLVSPDLIQRVLSLLADFRSEHR